MAPKVRKGAAVTKKNTGQSLDPSAIRAPSAVRHLTQICCECKRYREFTNEICTTCDHEDTNCCGVTKYWDCCHCEIKTMNDTRERRCNYASCNHEQCNYCQEYDPYEHVDLYDNLDSTNEAALEDNQYDVNLIKLFVDNEAEKVASYPPNRSLEKGPRALVSYEAFAALFEEAAQSVILNKMNDHVLNKIITQLALLDHPRHIRAVFSHKRTEWSYRSWDTINQIPWLLMYNKQDLKAEVEKIYKPAPQIGQHTYPWFNYEVDTLFLDFSRCRDQDEREQSHLISAIQQAGVDLSRHQLRRESPKLKFLAISYCAHIDDPNSLLQPFSSIKTLESVALCCHNHYDRDGTAVEDDDLTMQNIVNDGDLEDWPWPVTMENVNGVTIGKDDPSESESEEEEEEEDAHDDYDESEKDDESSEHGESDGGGCGSGDEIGDSKEHSDALFEDGNASPESDKSANKLPRKRRRVD